VSSAYEGMEGRTNKINENKKKNLIQIKTQHFKNDFYFLKLKLREPG
jgi:hypothetical protein